MYHPYKIPTKLNKLKNHEFSHRSKPELSEPNKNSVQSLGALKYVPYDLEYSNIFIAACDFEGTLYPASSDSTFCREQHTKNVEGVTKFMDVGNIVLLVTKHNISNLLLLNEKHNMSEEKSSPNYSVFETPNTVNRALTNKMGGIYCNGSCMKLPDKTDTTLEEHPLNKLMSGDDDFLKDFLKWFSEENKDGILGIILITKNYLYSFETFNNINLIVDYCFTTFGIIFNPGEQAYGITIYEDYKELLRAILNENVLSISILSEGQMKFKDANMKFKDADIKFKDADMTLTETLKLTEAQMKLKTPDELNEARTILEMAKMRVADAKIILEEAKIRVVEANITLEAEKLLLEKFEQFKTSKSYSYNPAYRAELSSNLCAATSNEHEETLSNITPDLATKIFEAVGNSIQVTNNSVDSLIKLDITVGGVNIESALGRFLQYSSVTHFLKTHNSIARKYFENPDNTLTAYNLAVFGSRSDDLSMFKPINGKYPICRVFMSSGIEKLLAQASNIKSEVAPVLNYLVDKITSVPSVSHRYSRKHVFITGGSGSLGGSLIETFLKENEDKNEKGDYSTRTHVYNIMRDIDQVVPIESEFYHYTIIGGDGLYNVEKVKYLFEIIAKMKIKHPDDTFYFIHSAADKDTPAVKKYLEIMNVTPDKHWTIESAKVIGRQCFIQNILLIYISTIYVHRGSPPENSDQWNNKLIQRPDFLPELHHMYLYGYTKAECERQLNDMFIGHEKRKLLSIIRLPGLFDFNMKSLADTSFGGVIKQVVNLSKNPYDNMQKRFPIDVSVVSTKIITLMDRKEKKWPIDSLCGDHEYTKLDFANEVIKKLIQLYHDSEQNIHSSDPAILKIKEIYAGKKEIFELHLKEFMEYTPEGSNKAVDNGLPTSEASMTKVNGITMENMTDNLLDLIIEELKNKIPKS